MKLFYDKQKSLRPFWWIPIFLFILAGMLIPLILLAKHYKTEIPFILQPVIIILATLICQWLKKEPLSAITGKFNPSALLQLLKGAAIGAVLMGVPALALTLIGKIHWQAGHLSAMGLLHGLYIFALVALAEELLFRGLLFRQLIQSTNLWIAQLIIALLFVLTHMGNPGMNGTTAVIAGINIFLASLLFGQAKLRTAALAMPIGIHLAANFVQGTVLGFGVSGNTEKGLLHPILETNSTWITGGEFGLEASVPCLITLILLILTIDSWLKKHPQVQ